MSWYEEGLKFKCTQCGKCCTGGPGYVWLDDEDIQILSKRLNLSKEDFLKNHCRNVGRRISLLEKKNYDCIFLKENKCSLYEARPKQCRKFPWWKDYIESREAWNSAKTFCEGIDHKEGTLFTPLEIDRLKNSP
jgi:Fe-S-cluster containining protein